MPSAQSFGDSFGLKRGRLLQPDEKGKDGKDLAIVKRSIGHESITANRVYRYPIELTISTKNRLKRKREEKDKIEGTENKASIEAVEAWFKTTIAGEKNKRLVWTFYGNPYDIWVEDTFRVKTTAFGDVVLTTLGHGTRSFSAPKKPPTLQSKKPSESVKKNENRSPLIQPIKK